MTAPQEKPRHLYRCPVKAAWAAKQLGLTLTTFASNGLVKTQSVRSISLHASYPNGGLGYRYYLHPDSVPVLLGLTADQKAAMELLGLWPESEA
jgi:hypothetical protein